MLQQLQQTLVAFLNRTFLRSVPNMLTLSPFHASHSWPFLPSEVRGGVEPSYRCHFCSDQFKREDHLRRHELSHGFPRFLCPHPGCGMRFHRNDVLKRHQAVHEPHPTKRRRRPRRGALPKVHIQSVEREERIDISLIDSSINSTTSTSVSVGYLLDQKGDVSPSDDRDVNQDLLCNEFNLDFHSCFSTTFPESTCKLNLWAETASTLQVSSRCSTVLKAYIAIRHQRSKRRSKFVSFAIGAMFFLACQSSMRRR